MSRKTLKKIVCPYCHESFETTIYESVNVTLDEDDRDKVLSGDIFHQECPHCHQEYMSQYPCLYHDQDMKFMVYLYDGPIDMAAMSAPLLEKGYILRRCRSIEDFIEKIQILSDGLDDRIVEFAKYDCFVDHLNNGGDIDQITGIHYAGLDNGILKITIRMDDKGMTMQIPYDALEADIEEHADMFAIEDPAFACIDSAWIIDIFKAPELLN